MRLSLSEYDRLIDVFVNGFSVGKSLAHPYEVTKIARGLWLMRDRERRNPSDYRKEEWITLGNDPRLVDQLARSGTRGRYFIGSIVRPRESGDACRDMYKSLGYRLIITEPFFVHSLKRIPRPTLASNRVSVRQVVDRSLAGRLGKLTRTRPIPEACWGEAGPFRQYVAMLDDEIAGWVRSVPVKDRSWCANLEVRKAFRRRGIGQTLLTHMLREDRRLGQTASVLLSSHSGALLYPQVGYKQIGTLYIFAPKK